MVTLEAPDGTIRSFSERTAELYRGKGWTDPSTAAKPKKASKNAAKSAEIPQEN